MSPALIRRLTPLPPFRHLMAHGRSAARGAAGQVAPALGHVTDFAAIALKLALSGFKPTALNPFHPAAFVKVVF